MEENNGLNNILDDAREVMSYFENVVKTTSSADKKSKKCGEFRGAAADK